MTEDQRSRLAHQQPQGLTLRQWYKGQVAAGLATTASMIDGYDGFTPWDFAEKCGQFADALIAEDEEHGK